MMKDKMQKATAKLVKKVVGQSLRVDANSTTCITVYQPKAPAKLKEFSKIDKK